LQKEHTFYIRLIEGLKSAFVNKKSIGFSTEDSDVFQAWLANGKIDTQTKAELISHSLYAAFGKAIQPASLLETIHSGNLSDTLNVVQ
ncbi:MAG: hypothetical protein JWQ25_2068, partial [Daejeonella sp.]|nr:hypothetical protein [Daejeonella sp.]